MRVGGGGGGGNDDGGGNVFLAMRRGIECEMTQSNIAQAREKNDGGGDRQRAMGNGR